MTEIHLMQQPQNLEDMAIDKIAAWIIKQGNNIKPTLALLYQLDPVRADTVLSKYVEIIRGRIERSVHRIFHDKLLTKTMAEVYRRAPLTHNRRPEIDDYTESTIITNERMVETVFTKNVTSLSLSFDQFHKLLTPLSTKSHLLTGLVSLDLKSNKPYYIFQYTVEVENGIIQMVQELHNLKYLNLLILDTDRIVRCIVRNCPLIEELALYTTSQISDTTMTLLTQLTNLRVLTLGADVSSSGYEIILLNCKKIEYINCLKPSERINMSRAVKRVVLLPNIGTLNLKSYYIHHETAEELRNIFEICPLIQNLIVSQTDASAPNNVEIGKAIDDFKYLREMTFYVSHNLYAPVKSVLEAVGRKIEHLSYIGGIEIDLDALIDLSRICPNLKTLNLSLRKDTYRAVGGRRLKMEISSPFTKLKELTLKVNHNTLTSRDKEFDNASIFFLLSNCPNVEFVEIHMPNWFTEDAMLKILSKNPLKYLKKMTVFNPCEQMTPLVMDRFKKNCINKPEVIEIMLSLQY